MKTERKTDINAYNRVFGYLFIFTFPFAYLYISSHEQDMEEQEKNML